MASKTLVRAKGNDGSDHNDFLPGDEGFAEVAYKSALKPLIGVNMDHRSAANSPHRQGVHGARGEGQGVRAAFSYLSAGYYDSIAKAGGIPVMIPPLTDEDDLQRVLDVLDGVVFCGGADLDPRNDGFMLHPSQRLLDQPPRGVRPPVDAAGRQGAGKCPSWGFAAACNC